MAWWNRKREPAAPEQRYSFDQYLQDMLAVYSFNGNEYVLQTQRGTGGEQIENSFASYVNHLYKRDGIVYACIAARALVLAEGRFRFRQYSNGEPGDYFGTSALSLFEQPWLNGNPSTTTGELIARLEQDGSLAGNAYVAKRRAPGSPSGFMLRRLRPDWVTIVAGSPNEPADDPALDLDATVAGFLYGPNAGDQVLLPASEVAHYSPLPDPDASYRGMSWLTPVLKEIQSDIAATDHKDQFFRHAATPNMVIRFDPAVQADAVEKFKAMMDDQHSGHWNAYRTLYLGGGADATVVGSNFQQMDFKSVQGAGETRIAVAAGVPAVVLGISEGLAGSSLNAGNYQVAKRKFGDATLQPLWRIMAASLQRLADVPAGAELSVDTRHIAFLRDDAKDEADIHAQQANVIRQLVDAGYDPDSVISAVVSGDFRRLSGAHSGLYSVQLQPPGEGEPPADEVAPDDRYVGLQEQVNEIRARLSARQIVDSEGNVILREEWATDAAT